MTPEEMARELMEQLETAKSRDEEVLQVTALLKRVHAEGVAEGYKAGAEAFGPYGQEYERGRAEERKRCVAAATRGTCGAHICGHSACAGVRGALRRIEEGKPWPAARVAGRPRSKG